MADASEAAAFDPAHVPPFPVLTLHLDEELETVTLDGAPVEPASGESVKNAGIAAVVAQLHRRQIEAVRVRVTTPGEDTWHMVVTADGDTWDTTPADEEEVRRRSLSRRRLLIGGGVLALLGIGGTAAAVVPRVLAEDQAPAWQPPGQGEQIPVATPPGFARQAQWAVPVGRSADVCRIVSGHIGTVSDENVLTLRHPDTGQPQWSGASAPDTIAEARRTFWDTQEVIAVTSSTQLSLWPLATADPAVPTTPTVISLDQDHRAELNGPRPFIELTEWFVDLPAANQGTRRVTIPAGTRAALHQDDGALHTIGAHTVHHLDATGAPSGEHELDMHDRPTTMPTGVWALTDDLVLTSWDEDGTRLALIRPADGAVLMDQTAEDRIDQDTEARFLGGSCLLLSRTVIFYGTHAFTRTLDDFSPTAAHGDTLYGTSERTPATLDLTDENAEPQPWQSFRNDDPPPRIVTDKAAYVIAPRLDETVLYSATRA